MENSNLGVEERQLVQKLLYGLEQFENGDDEYLEYALAIVDAIKDYNFLSIKNYIIFKFLLTVSKIATFVSSYELINDSEYIDLITWCENDLEYYKTSAKELKKYVKKTNKTGEYYNLDAAYILTIKLSEILTNISSYLKEIRMMEKVCNGMFSYRSNKDVRLNANKTNEEISTLVKSLTIKED